MNSSLPKQPMIFDKPLSSIIKSGSVMSLYRKNEIHHEIELGVLIGQQAKNINHEDWDQYVGGYFLGIDFTDRDLQSTAKKLGSPWSLAKGQDQFFAISDFVPKENVIDPHNLELLLTINDKPVQNDNTKQMIFKIPDLLVYISKYMTLNEGDMILTGTPSGVGRVKPGDDVKAYLKQNNEQLAFIELDISKGHG